MTLWSFTPIAGVPGTSVTTTFALSDKSSAYATPTVNSTTSVINSDPAAAPTLATLVSFDGSDGKTPDAGLTADAAGDVFGATAAGGAYGDGVVFEIVKTSGGYASTPSGPHEL